MIVTILGHIGLVLLAFSSLPQLVKTFKSKDVSGVSPTMLLCWSMGCFSMGLYVFLTTAQTILLLNYGFNTIIVGITTCLYFKYRNYNKL
jgi:uncharacterized protein with PQ loop repeat